MGSRAAGQALVPGRVVLLADAASGLPELAAICGAPHSAPSRGIQLGPAPAAAGASENTSCGCAAVTALRRSRVLATLCEADERGLCLGYGRACQQGEDALHGALPPL